MKSITRVLITGFEPFAGDSRNPSMLLAERIREEYHNDAVVLQTAVIPVVFQDIKNTIEALYTKYEPDVVIHVGQADGRSYIGLERFAVNLIDAPIRDNVGVQPIDEPCDPHGPLALMSTIPVKRIVAELRKEGIPSRVSNTAGTYLCNAVLYHSLRTAQSKPGRVRAGLVHVPLLPDQAAERGAWFGEYPHSMSLEVMVRALQITIDQAVIHENDEHLALGSLS